MNRWTVQSGSLLTLAVLAAPAVMCAQGLTGLGRSASVSGVIRDSEGIPQMGALVEALLPDASIGGSALTDSRGQYRFYLEPGKYRIRASAALLLPALRERLQVAYGSRAVVDLTLAAMLAPGGWLPASRRASAEPADDWMWTLRSSASRSILRLTTPDEEQVDGSTSGGVVAVSSSRQESRRGATSGRITLKDNDGGFGRGGSHQALVLTRVNEDGGGAVLRTDFSGTRSPYPVSPSAEISAGMQRQTPLNGYWRTVATYSSHPELVDSRGATGMQGITVRSGQRIELGDLVRVDVGSVVRNSNLRGNAFIMEPFLRVATHPGSDVVISYTMTSARGTESLEDLDRVQAPLPLAVVRGGHLQLESGTHHALSVEGKVPGGGVAEVVFYQDHLRNPLIAGTGVLTGADAQTDGLVADPTTRTYRVAARDYQGSGVRVLYQQSLTKALHAGAEVSTGTSLQAPRQTLSSMRTVLDQLSQEQSYAATAFLDGKVLRTNTSVRAAYRWQPHRTLTAVDAFRAGDDSAYLSCTLRQSLGKMPFLPRGLEALVDVQNLLAEGYQPFISSDGQTLFLAQTPRTLQAGLSFSF